MSKNTAPFEKSFIDTKKLPPVQSYRNEAHYSGDADDISTASEAADVYFASLPQRLNSLTTEFGQSLFSQEIENDHIVNDWWQANVSFSLIQDHESYADICLDDRRRLITSAISAVYFLSLLADKTQTRGLSSHLVKFVACTAAKSVLRVYQKCETALMTIQDSLLLKEIQTLKSLIVLGLANCFVIMAIVAECDAKENRKVNASSYGPILIGELRDLRTPEDIQMQIISAFESVLQTSILTRMPWRSGTKTILQELTQACIEISLTESASDLLVERTRSLLVLLAWKNIKVTAQITDETEADRSSFQWLTALTLDKIEGGSKYLYKALLEDANEMHVESHTHQLRRLLALLLAFLEKGKRDSDSAVHSVDYVAEPTIPMDRVFRVLNDLAKCIVSMISVEVSSTKEKRPIRNTSLSPYPDGLKHICDLTLRLMRVLISRVESSRISMAGEAVSEFLERLFLLPRDPLVVIKLILYGGDNLGDLFKTLAIRSPSILLRESISRDSSSSPYPIGVHVAQLVRTKVCLADRITEQILKLLEMFRNAVIHIRSPVGLSFFEKISPEDRFDTRLVADKGRCPRSRELVSGCLKILSPLLRVAQLPETVESDLVSLVSWWLLTGLDALLQSVHLKLTLRGLNSVTANLLSLRQKNGQILSTMESVSLITYVMFQKDAAVYKTLLMIVQSILGLDPTVPSILEGPKLKVSPMLEAICTLVKLWNDVLNNDAFKLCVDEDGLILSQSLMSQIWLRLVTGGSLEEYRLSGIEMDLCARLRGNEELTVVRSAIDSPLLRDDQGLYLYQYDKGYNQQVDEHMSEGGDGFEECDGNDEMADGSQAARGSHYLEWKSPQERTQFMNGDSSPFHDELDGVSGSSSRVGDDDDDDRSSIVDGSSLGSEGVEEMGVSSGEEGYSVREAGCVMRSSSISEEHEEGSDDEDSCSNGENDYFMPREALLGVDVTTIIDDDEQEKEDQSNAVGNIENNAVTGQQEANSVDNHVEAVNVSALATPVSKPLAPPCDTSPDTSAEQTSKETNTPSLLPTEEKD